MTHWLTRLVLLLSLVGTAGCSDGGPLYSDDPLHAELQRFIFEFHKASEPDGAESDAWAKTVADYDQYIARINSEYKWSELVPADVREAPPSEEFDDLSDPSKIESTLSGSIKAIEDFGREVPEWLRPTLKAGAVPANVTEQRKKMLVNVLVIELAEMMDKLS